MVSIRQALEVRASLEFYLFLIVATLFLLSEFFL